MMITVLIADDEEIIRQGLCNMIEQDRDFRVVGQAEDGQEALDMALDLLPDVLFVDINMPFLNGLDLIEQLQKSLPDLMVVVVSGYDAFSFAQRALKMGVSEYLLKPVMQDDMTTALGRLKAALHSRRSTQHYIQWARQQFQKNREYLIEAFFQQWAQGHFAQEEIEEEIANLELDIPHPASLLAVQVRDQKGSGLMPGDWGDGRLLRYALRNIIEELLEQNRPVYYFSNGRDDLFFLFQQAAHPDDLASEIRDAVGKYLDWPVHVALCEKLEPISAFPDLYDQLLEQLDKRSSTSACVLKALDYLEDHFQDESLSLGDTATHVHVSPQHLSRLFRQECNLTFTDCLTQVRVRHAMRLLMQPQWKLYEIAEQVGYASQQYFSAAFKKLLGMSPLEYRRGARGEAK